MKKVSLLFVAVALVHCGQAQDVSQSQSAETSASALQASAALTALKTQYPQAFADKNIFGTTFGGDAIVKQKGIKGEWPEFKVAENNTFECVNYPGSYKPMTIPAFGNYVRKVLELDPIYGEWSSHEVPASVAGFITQMDVVLTLQASGVARWEQFFQYADNSPLAGCTTAMTAEGFAGISTSAVTLGFPSATQEVSGCDNAALNVAKGTLVSGDNPMLAAIAGEYALNQGTLARDELTLTLAQ